MSSPLQNNITNLQNLLDKVNALPNAGSGGVEVVDVKIYGEVSGVYYLDTSNNFVAVTEGGTYAVNCGLVAYIGDRPQYASGYDVYFSFDETKCVIKFNTDGYLSVQP